MAKIELIKGDITQINADAIVNAANTTLLGGGGVDGAIHRAAGPDLLTECRTLNGCNTGDVKVTGAYNLKSQYIIHAVGPVWRGGNSDEDALLASCYRRSLEVANENNLNSIAFPNISTGVYGFPKERASRISFDTVKNFLTAHSNIQQVIFVCFDEENFQLYQKLLQ
jgi:O-acetyl-ADP-ribose deacetylase (regulator of RNase III)